MDRRRVLQSGLAATLMATAGPAAQARMRASLREQLDRPLADRVGDMLLLGFIGSHNETEGADIIDAHLAANRIGGVLFLRHNVRSREGAEGSAARFLATRPGAWMAIDQEGGLVQRLSRDLGYTHLPRAMQVAESRSPQGAGDLYRLGAGEFRAAGFNMNLAPVADLHDPDNAVIGRHGRAYGTDGDTIAAYAAAFIDAFEAEGVACAIKHFPGHGRSRGDSHDGFVDISDSWSEAELAPFRELINQGRAHLMMGGHLTNRQLDPSGEPVTFSAPVLDDLLRGELGFTGVVMTDDLDMAAIRENYDQREAVIRAIEAGNDMIMLSNSAAPDAELPQRIVGWVEAAIADGRLNEHRINQSVARLAVLKARVGL
ncbi:glycoside hydrolase family 3 N-terminal domain-containing protein [Maricaulis sp.]|uniref:glycoside hydrolase family 3 N-terminal domain-containing protein n=1 Tax=Maricaulis sp. TaxID=1486257 RepID=UPI0026129A7E|nr:glycoside hydrolase family 3 N-terminal domain-containing protein [Maricaulis sp.]MDF1769052.1 glycoside hydrolase family 3 N-terminal domain-containing protein [Maricaulis sp.]